MVLIYAVHSCCISEAAIGEQFAEHTAHAQRVLGGADAHEAESSAFLDYLLDGGYVSAETWRAIDLALARRIFAALLELRGVQREIEDEMQQE